MPRSEYDPDVVYELKRRLWAEAYKFAKELKAGHVLQHVEKSTVSGLELLTVLHIMEEETRHHWIEDKKAWNDILSSEF
ncbi:MAG: hypothetical protein HY619_01840 [Thaumarchaeota archaeon]|nr:hypothetical protein [Nitrososphaerota archaeon]